MAHSKSMPTVVVFIESIREVQVHNPDRQAEAAGHALYERVRPLLGRIDKAARGAAHGVGR